MGFKNSWFCGEWPWGECLEKDMMRSLGRILEGNSQGYRVCGKQCHWKETAFSSQIARLSIRQNKIWPKIAAALKWKVHVHFLCDLSRAIQGDLSWLLAWVKWSRGAGRDRAVEG